MDSRGQTYTTIRYGINQKGTLSNPWPCEVPTPGRPGPGVCGGSDGGGNHWSSEGANVPLVSSHSGGVNVLFADGSVHFLTDGTDLLTLAQLATRDDGMVLNSTAY